MSNSFEYIAHNILRKGGYFDVRSLESTGDDPRPLTSIKPPSQDQILKYSNSIKDEKYYKPMDPKFLSIDAIIAPKLRLPGDYRKKSSFKMSGLKKLYKKIGWRKRK